MPNKGAPRYPADPACQCSVAAGGSVPEPDPPPVELVQPRSPQAAAAVVGKKMEPRKYASSKRNRLQSFTFDVYWCVILIGGSFQGQLDLIRANSPDRPIVWIKGFKPVVQTIVLNFFSMSTGLFFIRPVLFFPSILPLAFFCCVKYVLKIIFVLKIYFGFFLFLILPSSP